MGVWSYENHENARGASVSSPYFDETITSSLTHNSEMARTNRAKIHMDTIWQPLKRTAKFYFTCILRFADMTLRKSKKSWLSRVCEISCQNAFSQTHIQKLRRALPLLLCQVGSTTLYYNLVKFGKNLKWESWDMRLTKTLESRVFTSSDFQANQTFYISKACMSNWPVEFLFFVVAIAHYNA